MHNMHTVVSRRQTRRTVGERGVVKPFVKPFVKQRKRSVTCPAWYEICHGPHVIGTVKRRENNSVTRMLLLPPVGGRQFRRHASCTRPNHTYCSSTIRTGCILRTWSTCLCIRYILLLVEFFPPPAPPLPRGPKPPADSRRTCPLTKAGGRKLSSPHSKGIETDANQNLSDVPNLSRYEEVPRLRRALW